MEAVKVNLEHDVKALPPSCVCGECSSVVLIDWCTAEILEGGNLLHQSRCPTCGAGIINAIGDPCFLSFLAGYVR